MEMLGTALRALFLSASERSRFVSCTMEKLSLNGVDHKVRYALKRATLCDDLRAGQLAQSHLVLCGAGGYPEIFSRDLRDRQIIPAAEE